MSKAVDSLGRTRRKTQGGAGPKHLPDKTNALKAGAFQMAAPLHLGAHGKAWWRWAVTTLQKMGILDAADRKHIELCAETFEDYRNGQEDVRRYGRLLVQATPTGIALKRNPASVTVEKNRVILRSFYSDLALTPSARAKFGVGELEDDPFEELMKASRRGN